MLSGKFYKRESKSIVIVPMNKREIPIGTFCRLSASQDWIGGFLNSILYYFQLLLKE